MKRLATRYKLEATSTDRSPWLQPGSLHHHLPRYFGAQCALLAVFIYLRWSYAALTVVTIGYGMIPALAITYAAWRENRTSRLARQKKKREMMQAARERFGLEGR